MKAYYISSNKPATLSDLLSIGVKHWKLDPKTCESDGSLDKIRKEQKYTYSDVVTISKQHIQNFEEKLAIFFAEHIHLDDEIRFFLEGRGYFDVRDAQDEWIRLHCQTGDLIVLPAGIYHRFSLDDNQYAKVMRLFKGEPVWTPYNRSTETDILEARKKYLIAVEKATGVKAFVLDTKQPVSKAYLASLGVLHWKIDTKDTEKLNAIRKERGYNYSDICTVDPEHLPNFEEKVKSFFTEHIHTDEEIRYFLEGSGYFDVRGHNDEWIRIHCMTGDLIILPAGIYHRFSTDDKKYAQVQRLFVGEPVWTPYNRDGNTDTMSSRTKYVDSIQSKQIQYGRKDVVVENPKNFDAAINSIDSITTNHNETPIILYLTAANDPSTGQPWCPDARKAKPLVEQVLSELDRSFTLVTVPIIRSEYKDNPDYFYRTHPVVQLKKVPTIMIWKNRTILRQLIETEMHDIEKLRAFLNFNQSAL
jgi:1,2-dihydroxy-3-keto-5-methylthiopentene dioxygenase